MHAGVDLAHEDRLAAIMDIGTNTELIVGNRRRMMAASCPAGPAFEGGAIACGMPALEGAIEDVSIDCRRRVSFQTLSAAARPQGICGSGLVALLSELLRTGRMNDMGRFADGAIAHRYRADTASTSSKATSTNWPRPRAPTPRVCTRSSANTASISTRSRSFISPAALDGISAWKRRSASASFRISRQTRVVQAGNASIEGATIALLSEEKRGEMEAMVRRVEHCRLETHPRFFDFFVEGCQFKPIERLREVAAAWN